MRISVSFSVCTYIYREKRLEKREEFGGICACADMRNIERTGLEGRVEMRRGQVDKTCKKREREMNWIFFFIYIIYKSFGLQLIPSFVLVLHQQLSGVAGELFRFGHHPRGAVLQVAELFPAFQGQLMSSGNLAASRARPIAQRVQLRRRAGYVSCHEFWRFTAGRFANCRGKKTYTHTNILLYMYIIISFR